MLNRIRILGEIAYDACGQEFELALLFICICAFVHLCIMAHGHDMMCKALVFGPRRNVRAYTQALIRRKQGCLALNELCQRGTAPRLGRMLISVSFWVECQKFDLYSSPIFTFARFQRVLHFFSQHFTQCKLSITAHFIVTFQKLSLSLT